MISRLGMKEGCCGLEQQLHLLRGRRNIVLSFFVNSYLSEWASLSLMDCFRDIVSYFFVLVTALGSDSDNALSQGLVYLFTMCILSDVGVD